MLSKKDLTAIEAIVGASVKSAVNTAISASEARTIDTLRNEMSQNTQELIELITAGFTASQNQEVRISRIENKVFHNAI